MHFLCKNSSFVYKELVGTNVTFNITFHCRFSFHIWTIFYRNQQLELTLYPLPIGAQSRRWTLDHFKGFIADLFLVHTLLGNRQQHWHNFIIAINMWCANFSSRCSYSKYSFMFLLSLLIQLFADFTFRILYTYILYI